MRFKANDRFLKETSQFSVFADIEDALEVTKRLLDLTEEEIYNFHLCNECYYGLLRYETFEKLCKEPHLLVWCKNGHFPYWPAKLMSVDAANGKAEVRFFDDKYYSMVVQVKNCYLYSTERPNAKIKSTYKKAYEKTQEVNFPHFFLLLL